MLTFLGEILKTVHFFRFIRTVFFCFLLPDNVNLTWDREMGAATYGRVSFVFHELGVFAVKELTEVKFCNNTVPLLAYPSFSSCF